MCPAPAAVPMFAGPGWAREASGLMPGVTVRRSVTIPAVPEQVRVAREFVGEVLGESHPHIDVALLLASELVTNSVRHSGSAVPGSLVKVVVAAGDQAIRVEVTDRCGDRIPVLRPAGDVEDEGSRGLQLVDALAAQWGYQRGSGWATTWFELAQN
jgi:serine/threonine-protein kinase RsbW